MVARNLTFAAIQQIMIYNCHIKHIRNSQRFFIFLSNSDKHIFPIK